MKALRETKGFTLIELMITLALIGLVIAGGFSIYFFANRSFISGSLLADVQADMQIAMQRITEEVRLAHSMEIIAKTDVPSNPEEDDHYIFTENGSIFLRAGSSDTGTVHNRVILANRDGSDGYDLGFKPVMNGSNKIDNMIEVTLSSLNPKVDYELNTELQILNLRLSGISGVDESNAIYFTKTFTEAEYEEAEKINPGCFWRWRIFGDGAPELDQLRKFRDGVLAKNPLGRFVIRTYYAATPGISTFLERQPVARSVARTFFRGLGEFIIKFI